MKTITPKMSRKERKALYEKRRHDIIVKISNKMAEEMEHGSDFRQVLDKTKQWIQQQMRLHPQEQTLYLDAAQQYQNKYMEIARAVKDAKNYPNTTANRYMLRPYLPR